MKSRCGCVESLRKGSLQGVNFAICTNCRYLQWEPFDGSNFIESTFELELSDFPKTGKTLTVSELFRSVETHLGSLMEGRSNIKVDYRKLGYVKNGSAAGEDWVLSLDPDAAFEAMCAKLAEVWLDHRDNEAFQELLAYADLGFPLAYAIDTGMVEASPTAVALICDTYRLLLGLPVLDQTIDDSITIPLFSDITVWDIQAAEDEEQEEYMELVAERLHDYTTEEILLATLEDMFREMNDYMQRDTFYELKRHFSSFSVSGNPIGFSGSEMYLVHPLMLSGGIVVEPVIER